MSKIIVCGLGQVGYRVTRLLCRLDEDVTVVTLDARPGFAAEVEKMGARVIFGDSRNKEILVEAGIHIADSIICCTSSDLINIEIALDALVANDTIHVVARVFDVALGEQLKESVGIHQTLSMSRLAAPRFVAEAICTKAVGHFRIDNQNYLVEISEQEPDKEHTVIKIEGQRYLSIRPFENKALTEKVKKKDPVLSFLAWIPNNLKILLSIVFILAAVSTFVFSYGMKLSIIDSLYFVVTTLTTTGYGDITPKTEATWLKVYTIWMMLLGSVTVAALYSIITETLVSSRIADLTGRQSLELEDHVVVAGVGNVGYRICQSLVNQGVKAVAIDSENKPNLARLLPKSVPYLLGDGRDHETLDRACIGSARAIISTTDDDSVNLSIGLAAKKMNPNCRVVIRLFDGNFAQKVEQSLNIDNALSSASLCASGFVGAALFENCVFAFATQHELIAVLDTEEGFTVERRDIRRSS